MYTYIMCVCVCACIHTYILIYIYYTHTHTHTHIPAPVIGIAQVFNVTPARARCGRAHGAGAARAFVREPLNSRADILLLNATGPVAMCVCVCVCVCVFVFVCVCIYMLSVI